MADVGDLCSEFLGILDHGIPLFGGDGGQFHFFAFHAEFGFTAPVPDLAVVVGAVNGEFEQFFGMVGDLGPALGVGKAGAAPGHAVKLSGLEPPFDGVGFGKGTGAFPRVVTAAAAPAATVPAVVMLNACLEYTYLGRHRAMSG